mmetsp:Transcript_44556/g.90016  ORF Transcript_44556/g.90016 Transcript_44556/m.90016 type:complete len:85 (+) Transcript_44556:128-382(+)
MEMSQNDTTGPMSLVEIAMKGGALRNLKFSVLLFDSHFIPISENREGQSMSLPPSRSGSSRRGSRGACPRAHLACGAPGTPQRA